MNRSFISNNRLPEILVGVVHLVDMAIIILCAWGSYYYRHGHIDLPPNYFYAIGVVVFMASLTFSHGGIYTLPMLNRPWHQMQRLLPMWSAVIMVLLAGTFFSKTSEEFSRQWIVLWFGSTLMIWFFMRLGLHRLIQVWYRRGWIVRRVAIIGASDLGRQMMDRLSRRSDPGIRVVGIYDDRKGRLSPEEVQGYQILGVTDDLIDHIRHNQVDSVIVALPWNADRRLAQLVRQLRQVPVDVELCLDRIGFRLRYTEVTHIAAIPMLLILNKPLRGWQWLIKGAEDYLVASLALLLFAPLMLVIAMAIRLDSPGPVFFRQMRLGFNNQPFAIYKFRSMYNQPLPDSGTTVQQATRHDARITRVGRWLRRSSLDELPQLFNVILGEMSVVGPRPHAIQHDDVYSRIIVEYSSRFRVKPGITGWAQVNGLRGETSNPQRMAKRIEYDLYYIDQWSLLLDIRILFMTLFVGFVNENAF